MLFVPCCSVVDGMVAFCAYETNTGLHIMVLIKFLMNVFCNVSIWVNFITLLCTSFLLP